MRKQQKAKQPKRKPRSKGRGRLAVALEVIEVLSPIICALIVARLTKWEWE